MSGEAAAACVKARRAEAVDDSDGRLVARTKRGDVEAFSELVRRHHRVVYNLAYRFMRDGALAEDMAQEAFLKAFRLILGFRGDCSFSSWMYGVTCSVCLTELKRRRKRGELHFASMRGIHDAKVATEAADLPELVRRCVSLLPKRYALVITLYYFEGISYDEIAGALRIPMGTLKTWMHRARHELRGIVERELGSDVRTALP